MDSSRSMLPPPTFTPEIDDVMDWIQRIEAYTKRYKTQDKFEQVLDAMNEECRKRMRLLVDASANDERKYTETLMYMQNLTRTPPPNQQTNTQSMQTSNHYTDSHSRDSSMQANQSKNAQNAAQTSQSTLTTIDTDTRPFGHINGWRNRNDLNASNRNTYKPDYSSFTCHSCNKGGHIAKDCPDVERVKQKRDTSRENDNELNCIDNTKRRRRAVEGTCMVNDKPVKFQADTGADISIISASKVERWEL